METSQNTVCFEQILEAAPYKAAAAQPVTFHLTKHSTQTIHAR